MSENTNIIAIDGPAASGKGTLSRALADTLNFAHMDTGALYRAVALELLQVKGNPELEGDALSGVQALEEKIRDGKNPLNNPALRTDEIAQAASKVAALGEARARLVDLQRDFAQHPGTVYQGAILDGRDIGTVICPEAKVKLYVTADIEIRAQRRMKELQSKGLEVTYSAVLDDMRARDERDQARKEAPLRLSEDAFVIDSSHLTQGEMLEMALDYAKKALVL